MKTLIATAAAFAAVATLSAAPAMAENTVSEQRYKLERILDMQKGDRDMAARADESKSRTSDRVISTRMLTGPERAQARLARSQPDAATGGR